MKTADRQRLIRKHIHRHFGMFGGAKIRRWISEGRIVVRIERGRVKFKVDDPLVEEMAELQKNHEVYGVP